MAYSEKLMTAEELVHKDDELVAALDAGNEARADAVRSAIREQTKFE